MSPLIKSLLGSALVALVVVIANEKGMLKAVGGKAV